MFNLTDILVTMAAFGFLLGCLMAGFAFIGWLLKELMD